jgi:hypothetical protein
MNDYHREQLEAILWVRDHLKRISRSDRVWLKRRIKNYLRFRKEVDQFLDRYFSNLCTEKCYQDHYSACCSREGITTFFADVFINGLVSSDEEIEKLVHVLSRSNVGMKCVYLGQQGCLWAVKPIVCAMFLCKPARKAVFAEHPRALKGWQGLKRRGKRYTWPNQPVLFDALETYCIRAGHASGLMYFHNSPGLLRVKHLAMRKKQLAFQEF